MRKEEHPEMNEKARTGILHRFYKKTSQWLLITCASYFCFQQIVPKFHDICKPIECVVSKLFFDLKSRTSLERFLLEGSRSRCLLRSLLAHRGMTLASRQQGPH